MSGPGRGVSVWQSDNSPKPVCPTAKPLRIQPRKGRQGKRFSARPPEFGRFPRSPPPLCAGRRPPQKRTSFMDPYTPSEDPFSSACACACGEHFRTPWALPPADCVHCGALQPATGTLWMGFIPLVSLPCQKIGGLVSQFRSEVVRCANYAASIPRSSPPCSQTPRPFFSTIGGRFLPLPNLRPPRERRGRRAPLIRQMRGVWGGRMRPAGSGGGIPPWTLSAHPGAIFALFASARPASRSPES